MNKFQSINEHSVQRSTSNRWINQVTPSNIQQHNLPNEHTSSFIPDSIISSSSSLNRFSRNNNIKDNNKRTKILLISIEVVLLLITLIATAICIYLLILTNKITITTTTSSTTTALIVCVNDNSLITFDDQTPYAAVPNGYKNILWTNAYVYTYTTNTSGYYTGIVSHPNMIYNGGANPMTIQTSTGRFFNLYSLAVAAAWYDNLKLSVVGYKSNAIIVNNTFTLQVFTVSYITFTGYSGLDTVIFTTFGGTQNIVVNGSGQHFAMDNICLTFT